MFFQPDTSLHMLADDLMQTWPSPCLQDQVSVLAPWLVIWSNKVTTDKSKNAIVTFKRVRNLTVHRYSYMIP